MGCFFERLPLNILLNLLYKGVLAKYKSSRKSALFGYPSGIVRENREKWPFFRTFPEQESNKSRTNLRLYTYQISESERFRRKIPVLDHSILKKTALT